MMNSYSPATRAFIHAAPARYEDALLGRAHVALCPPVRVKGAALIRSLFRLRGRGYQGKGNGVVGPRMGY